MNYKNFALAAACLLCTLSSAQKEQKNSAQKQNKSQKSAQEIKSKQEFQDVLKNNDFVVAEFYSPACPHCKSMASVVEEVAAANPDVAVIKISAFENNNKALFDEYNVNAYPAFVFIKKGRIDSKMMGKSPRQALEKKVKELKNK